MKSCVPRVTFLSLLILFAAPAQSQHQFAPVWRTVPWDSGGLYPNSIVWSMVASGLDLDRDSKKEFLVTSAWSGIYHNSVYLYEAAGNNNYELIWSYSFYPYTNDYSAVTVGDLDGNGRQEILCLIDPYDSTYHGFYVFEWNGSDNGFPAVPTATWNLNLPGAFDEGTAIIAADCDNDSRDEVAVSLIERFSIPKSRFMIFSLAVGSTFTNPVWNIEYTDTTTFAYVGYALQATDLDRDGRKEIVAVGWDWLHIALYENTGSPDGFVRAASIAQIDTTIDFSNMGFVEANFDNNSTNELYIGTATGRVYVMTNPGDVSLITRTNFTLLGQYNPLRGIAGATKGDMDGNGIPELYLAGRYHEAVFQWKYTSGPVTSPQSYARALVYQDDTTDQRTPGSDQGWLRPSKVAVGDFDSDGRADIVIASASFARDKPILMVIEQIPTDIAEAQAVPLRFGLRGNYPNPFSARGARLPDGQGSALGGNPATRIRFEIPGPGFVTLKVYDAAGREVTSLVNDQMQAGSYDVGWNAKGLSSGVYFGRLQWRDRVDIRKFMLVR